MVTKCHSMGCACEQALESPLDWYIIAHAPACELQELPRRVLRGKRMLYQLSFSKSVAIGIPVSPYKAYLSGSQYLCYYQIVYNVKARRELLCLFLPLSEQYIFEVEHFVALDYGVYLEQLFFNAEGKVKLALLLFEDEYAIEMCKFNLMLKYHDTFVPCFAEYENNQFLYSSPAFNAFVSQYVEIELATRISANQMVQLGFSLAKSPVHFVCTPDTKFQGMEQDYILVAMRHLRHKEEYISYCVCYGVDSGLATIMNLANQLMDKIQESFIHCCRVLFLTRKFAVFSFYSGYYNTFSLNVGEVTDFQMVEELKTSKISQLYQKYQTLNYNLARKRVSDFQSSEMLFENVPSLKTKVLFHYLPQAQKECIVSLLDGINKVSAKLTVQEFNQLISVVRAEFFELFHIYITYFPELQVVTTCVRNEELQHQLIQEQVDYFKRCVPVEYHNLGSTYNDQRFEFVYRVFRAVSTEYDGIINYKECYELWEDRTRSSYFVQALFSYICQLNGLQSFVVTNAAGAAISVMIIEHGGEKTAACVDFDNRMFLVNENVLPQRFAIPEFEQTNKYSSIFKKYFFCSKNVVMLYKFVRQLIESSDAMNSLRFNTYSSFNTSTQMASTQMASNTKSVHSSTRIDMLERYGKWEVRLAVLDYLSYDYFIDNFQYCLSQPNGQIALDLKQRNYGQIVSLSMRFSDPLCHYSSQLRNRQGLYLIEAQEIDGMAAQNNDSICGVANLGQANLLAIWSAKK